MGRVGEEMDLLRARLEVVGIVGENKDDPTPPPREYEAEGESETPGWSLPGVLSFLSTLAPE